MKSKEVRGQKVRKREKRRKGLFSQVLLLAKIAVLALPLFVWLQMDETSYNVFSSHSRAPSRAGGMPLSHDQRVNRMLREVDEKLRWESAKVEVENYHYAPDVNAVRNTFRLDETLQYGIKEQEVNTDILAVMGEDEEQRPTYVLDEQINTKLWSAEMQSKHNEKTNEEYVKTFLENARRAGYQVTLDQDFRILNVRKIRRGKPLF